MYVVISPKIRAPYYRVPAKETVLRGFVFVVRMYRELSIGSELIALVMIPQPFVGVCYQQQPSRGRVTGLRIHSYSWSGSVTQGLRLREARF